MTKVIIVGGVAGGASAAARLRRLKEDFEITVLERGPYVSFANCGLPYYVGNVIKDREQLELMTPEKFLNRFNINVKINHEAISIDRESKSIEVKDLKNDSVEKMGYDYLVLSPGASPIVPSFQGLEDVPTFTLRTIPDSIAIKNYAKENHVKKAAVIGGGYIGLEMAENLKKQGIRVKIVEMLDQVLAPLDKEMAQFVHEELILNGVCLHLEDPVMSFACTEDNCYHVIGKSGHDIETDMIVMAIGVKPESELAKDADLEIGAKGHIAVDDHMRTSDPSIFAVGDAVQRRNFLTNQPTAIPLAGPANKQGRIAADNIAGRDSRYNGVLGASVLKVFDLTVAFVGLTEKQLAQTDLKYEKIYVHPNNHAGYYPGATPMTFKLLFEVPSGKILGAQIVGGKGSEKRVDVISTMIKMGGTVFDLEELELTYAPPFGSAKDPVNMAGYVASNVIKGDHPIWHWNQLDEIKKNNSFFLDVRTPEEFMVGAIEGATNIDDLELREKLDKIPKDKDIYAYCQVGFRGYLVTRLLMQKGYNVKNLTGGYKLFQTATATTEELAAACGPPEEIVEEMVEKNKVESDEFLEIDACGLSCPGPLNSLVKGVEKLSENKKLKIYATDPGFKSSVEAYVDLTEGVNLIELGREEGKIYAILEKTAEISKEEIEEKVRPKKKTRQEMRGPDAPPVSDITPEELYERMDSDDSPAIILDVRTKGEYQGIGGHIRGSKNVPLGDLMGNIGQFDQYKDKEVVLLCAVGGRSQMAAQLLARAGFKDVRNLVGGMNYWRRKGLPVEKA